MHSIAEEMRLEGRATSKDPWAVLNRTQYSLGNTPTEKADREEKVAAIHSHRSSWQQRYEPFRNYQFRIVKEPK